jgi:predicted DNA-binding transcriptional regulator AlpA
MSNIKFLKQFETLSRDVKELKNGQLQILKLLEDEKAKSKGISNHIREWISAKEACQIIGCSDVHLWKLRKAAEIPFTQIKRTIRFKKIDIINYLNQNNL